MAQSRYSNISFQLAISLSRSLCAKSQLPGMESLNKGSRGKGKGRKKGKETALLSACRGYHFSFLLPFIFLQEFTASILAGLPVDGGNEI